jgi:methanogenic corrinoid protein MtbC1
VSATATTEQSERPDLEEACRRYVQALERSSMREAVKLVADLVRGGTPLDQVVAGVLAPAQVEVGRRWEQGRWSVAQEHTATGITEIALQTAVLSAPATPAGQERSSLVLACADGEWHALSARMAADVLRAAGVDVTYVGASLPVEALGEFLAVRNPTALGLSCSTAMTLVGARDTIEEAHAAGFPVLVAGSAFGSDRRRAEAIGADGWVAGPSDAVPLLAAWEVERPAFGTALDPGTDEWRELSTAPTDWVRDITRRLTARRPRLQTQSKALLARLEKEAAYLLRCCAGVELTADPRMLEEYTVWLRGVLSVRKVPVDLLDDLYAGAAETLLDRAPAAAELIESVRRLLAPRGVDRREDGGVA